MSDEILLTIGEDGKCSLYDDTYDITIHCESKEEHDEVMKELENIPHWIPHWIPVTEDTPTEDDDYWCTFGAETGWFVDWCSWYHGRWVVWLNDIPNDVSNVIAWCKPMEPYKGVTT